MNNKIKVIIFDMAGTTVKDNGGIVNEAFRSAFGRTESIPTPEQVNAVMGMAKPEAIFKILGMMGVPQDQGTIKRVHNNFVEIMIDFYENDPSVGEVERTSEVFRKLNELGIKVALNTGFSRNIAETIVNRLGWIKDGLVHELVCSDDVVRGRPHPDMIFEIIKRFNIPDTSCVMKVGDTPSDLEEGLNASCGLVVCVTNGSHSRKQLEAHPNASKVYLFDSLSDILNLL